MIKISKNTILNLAFWLLSITSLNTSAQCALNVYGGVAVPNSGTAFVTWSNYGPGYYVVMPVLSGGSYAISTCGAPFDTQISLWDPSGTTAIGYNDDYGPLCSSTAASIDNFVPNFTNYMNVQISQYSCLPGGSSSINVYYRQNNNIVFTSASTAMCSGQTRSLTATPANVGSAPGGYGNPGSFSGTGVSGNVFTAPAVSAPTNFTITYTFGYVSQNQIITVNPNPILSASVSNSAVCIGNTVTLSGGGANTYTWTGGVSNAVAFSPTSSASYTVTGTSTAGCTGTSSASASITVNALPVITTSITNTVVCNGASVTLSAGGASTYTWSGGVTNATPFTASATTNYTVTGTNANSCTNTAVRSLSVNPLPVITANTTSSVICSGSSITLSGAGASTYTWSGGVTNGVAFVPSASGNYTVTGTDANSCTNTAVRSITVNANPTITANSGVICSGKSFTIVPGGASTYTISGGTATVSPLVNSTYTVTGTNSLGCVGTSSAVSSVTVNTTPTLSINSSNNPVCSGTNATLTASGASSYTWNTAANTSSIVVAPTATTAYNVSGTSSLGCVSNSIAITLNTNPLPVISASGGSICPGATYTFVPTGATSYTYASSTSTISGLTATVAPLTTTSYTVSGTNANGCISTGTNNAVSSVFVFASPTLVVSASLPTVCPGAASTLSVTGANTYTWSTSTIGSSISVNPTSQTVYSVSGTGTNICNGFKSFTMNVYPTPTITVNSGTICSGYVFTMVPGGASTYTYSNGSSTVTPLTNTNYFVTGTSAQGCTAAVSATAAVTVIASPTISALSGSMCAGVGFSLSPSGANTYTISSSSSTNVVNPAVNTTYSVSGTGTNGCVSLLPATATVTVISNPTVTATSAASAICAGQSSVVLSASGASTYVWNTTATSASISVSPTTATVYSVTGASSVGCVGTATVAINVNPLPPVTITSNTNFVCAGKSATLTASGANTYSWSTGSTSLIVSVSPVANTTYTLTGTDNLGCVNTATTSVTVNTIVVSVVPAGSVCLGSTYTLSANGAVTYTWNNVQFFQSYPVTPTVATVYTVAGTDANNCITSNTVALGVYPLPNVTSTISNSLICVGESATITAGGATSYTWDNGSNNTSIVVSPTVTVSYNYTVTGTDANNCSASSVSTLAVSACTGIDKVANSNPSFKVYPNPNNGEFSIQSDSEMSLVIVNELGQIIKTISLSGGNNHTVNLSALSSGIYFVMSVNSSDSIRQKVIVTK